MAKGNTKAVAGEQMQLGASVLDVDRRTGPGTYAQDSTKIKGGKAMAGSPEPGGIGQEVKLKGTSHDDRFAGPGGNQEVKPKTAGGIKLAHSD